MGEDGLRASFASRIEPCPGGGPPSITIYMVHEYESMTRNRFKTVVGRLSFGTRSCRHDHPALPALHRANRPHEEHGPLLCSVHRTEPVWGGLPDTALGKDWDLRADPDPPFRAGERCRRSLPRTASTKAEPRIWHRLAKQTAEPVSPTATMRDRGCILIDYDDKALSRKFRLWFPFTVCGAITIATIIASPTNVEAAERVKLSTAIEKCTASVRNTCVVDGDTLWLRGNKIRVADIDTPEISEPKCPSELALGNRATERFIALINEGPFEMQAWPGRGVDRYRRKLRVLVRNGRSLGDLLVSEGLARTWTGRREPWCDR